MLEYVNQPKATANALHRIEAFKGDQQSLETWYVNLGDVGFWRGNPEDGQRDFFWQTRDSNMLIKGGSNYSYEQINAELSAYIEGVLQAHPATTDGLTAAVAVCGVKLHSEHEDVCVACIELLKDGTVVRDEATEALLRTELHPKKAYANGVTKGSIADFVRFGRIDRNFKGAVLTKELQRKVQKEMIWVSARLCRAWLHV
eukprot:INCI5924.3.p1 GENE.INCI5924.3~~INCI5924.3.p1  ORF type:complete len:201 (-),score=34.90 INCI5924.3:43-645(-)